MGKGEDDDCTAARIPMALALRGREEPPEADAPGRARPHGSRPRQWTDASLEAELRAFVAQRSDWPTLKQFRAAGRGDLVAAMAARGGTAEWAKRLGFEPRAPGMPLRWTEERLERELRELVAGRDDFPTAEELRKTGRHDLLGALERHGGFPTWARRFGFQPRVRGESAWPQARIEAELRAFVGQATRWPTMDAFYRAGKADLYMAVRRTGGIDHWAHKLGLERTTPPVRHEAGAARYPDEEAVRVALADFVEGRTTFPTQREFRAAGLRALLAALYKHGGAARWAEECGLAMRAPGNSRGPVKPRDRDR